MTTITWHRLSRCWFGRCSSVWVHSPTSHVWSILFRQNLWFSQWIREAAWLCEFAIADSKLSGMVETCFSWIFWMKREKKNHKIKAAKKMKRLTHRGSRRSCLWVCGRWCIPSQSSNVVSFLLFSSFSLMKITSALINERGDENFPASMKN